MRGSDRSSWTSSEHEEALSAFVTPTRRRRFRESLSDPRRRTKLVARFAHFKDLDARYATRVEGTDSLSKTLVQVLRAKGAPSQCYLLSDESSLDGRVMDLEDALEAVVGWTFGTFVSSLPGRLAYFEGEDGQYILERPSS
jgi:hypothetical protein